MRATIKRKQGEERTQKKDRVLVSLKTGSELRRNVSTKMNGHGGVAETPTARQSNSVACALLEWQKDSAQHVDKAEAPSHRCCLCSSSHHRSTGAAL